MARTIAQVSIRTSPETKEYFQQSFEGSGANSYGEFLSIILDKYTQQEKATKKEPVIIEVEKQIRPDEILFSLSPVQMFALKQTVLSSPDFARRQNEIIESLNGSSPFLYFGNLYDPELQKIWIRNIELKKEMTPEEKEQATRHNMSAFLINMFLMHAIDGNLSATNINAEKLKDFIRNEAIAKKQNKSVLKDE